MAALAVVAARNEAPFLTVLLPLLIKDGFDIVVLNHSSRDATREVAESLLGNGVLEVIALPWQGSFDLKQILSVKATVYERYPHEWLAHFDADEWPRATQDVPLVSLLAEVRAGGFQSVNFDEFVFVPRPGTDALGMDFRRVITDYYFFEPRPARLQRIWHRDAGRSNMAAAGHIAPVDPSRVWPQSQSLRHYVGLSQSAAYLKRANREYPDEALARGWHSNRLRVSSAPVGHFPGMRRCSPWDARELDRSEPVRRHYWEP
ncbi:MAG: hypothetical protein R2737_14905 [Candidatus Nanopelagicales bacterium]